MAQLVKNPPAMQETPVRFLGREDPLEKGYASHSSILSFPCGSAGKESACIEGDLGSIGKIHWRRERLPPPVFWPGEFHGLYSLCGCKESDTTERLPFTVNYQPFSAFFWSSPSVKSAFKCILYHSPLYSLCHSHTYKFYKALFALIIHNTDFPSYYISFKKYTDWTY